MGGRNAYSASSKSIETKDFKTLGFDGKLTYIQSIVNRAKDPVRSNSPNPIYVVVDSDGTARSLYFYKNHKVYKSIDLKHGAFHHSHSWQTVYVKKYNHYSSERVNPKKEHKRLTKKEDMYVRRATDYLKQLKQ